ncbi:MAG: LptF/LptG family permease [Chthoniobacterales bacterium]
MSTPANATKIRSSKRPKAFRCVFPVLPFYIFKIFLFPTLAVGAIVFFALSLERILRLVQVITHHGASANEAWGLIIYLIPHYLGLAIPAGFFFGVILGIRRLHDRSELVVMRSFGLSIARLYLPLAYLALILTGMMIFLTNWGQPYARYLFRNQMSRIVSGDPLGGLDPDVYLPIGEDNIVRAKNVREPGKLFDGFFMARQTAPKRREFLTATSAEVLLNKSQTGELNLMLRDGILIREDENESQLKTISLQIRFNEMPVNIVTSNIVAESGPRGESERELTSPELFLMPDSPLPIEEAQSQTHLITPAQKRAEFHWREAQTFSVPILGALGLVLGLLGQGRSAKARGLALGLVILVLFEKTSRLGKIMVENDQLSPWIGIWGPEFLLLIIALLAYRFFSGDHPRRRAIPSQLHTASPQS